MSPRSEAGLCCGTCETRVPGSLDRTWLATPSLPHLCLAWGMILLTLCCCPLCSPAPFPFISSFAFPFHLFPLLIIPSQHCVLPVTLSLTSHCRLCIMWSPFIIFRQSPSILPSLTYFAEGMKFGEGHALFIMRLDAISPTYFIPVTRRTRRMYSEGEREPTQPKTGVCCI